MTDQDDLLRRLAREVRDHAGTYTRAYGREDNAARVLELTDGDTYMLGHRMLTVLDTGADPGDRRYLCGVADCGLSRGHSGIHEGKPDALLRTALAQTIHDSFLGMQGGEGITEPPNGGDMQLAGDILARFTVTECEHDVRCCRQHGTHVSPHRGCILR